jgi:hypothetical protein
MRQKSQLLLDLSVKLAQMPVCFGLFNLVYEWHGVAPRYKYMGIREL